MPADPIARNLRRLINGEFIYVIYLNPSPVFGAKPEGCQDTAIPQPDFFQLRVGSIILEKPFTGNLPLLASFSRVVVKGFKESVEAPYAHDCLA